MTEQQRKPRRDWGPWIYCGGGVLALVGVWALNVFTVQGLFTAVWPWTDATGLLWPWATRVVWWVIFWQVAVAVEMRSVWREARFGSGLPLEDVNSKRQLWLAAHVSVVHRLLRRARYHWAAVPNARTQWARRPQPAPALSSAPGVVPSPVQGAPVAEPKAA